LWPVSRLPEAHVPTTVEVLAEAFKEAGTPLIVGHPGGESVELMDGMRFLLMKQVISFPL
jgi:acetolactate synthase I/II/III large subunit